MCNLYPLNHTCVASFSLLSELSLSRGVSATNDNLLGTAVFNSSCKCSLQRLHIAKPMSYKK